jgi:hypothetical protein
MNWLLWLYPAEWRKRYGEEFAAVLADQPASLGVAFDVFSGAIDAHLYPQIYYSQSKQNEGDTMTNEMLQRCVVGGPKPSQRDQGVASMFMVGSGLVMALAYVVLTKIYRTRPAVEAFGYASFPVMCLIYTQTAYLRKRPIFTQILVAVAGIAAMYLFFFGVCVIASKL